MVSNGIHELSRAAAYTLIAAALFLNAARLNAADLAKHLLGGANAVAVVRQAEILETERARADVRRQRHEVRCRSGEEALTPWGDTLVVGSLVNPSIFELVRSAAGDEIPS